MQNMFLSQDSDLFRLQIGHVAWRWLIAIVSPLLQLELPFGVWIGVRSRLSRGISPSIRVN